MCGESGVGEWESSVLHVRTETQDVRRFGHDLRAQCQHYLRPLLLRVEVKQHEPVKMVYQARPRGPILGPLDHREHSSVVQRPVLPFVYRRDTLADENGKE